MTTRTTVSAIGLGLTLVVAGSLAGCTGSHLTTATTAPVKAIASASTSSTATATATATATEREKGAVDDFMAAEQPGADLLTSQFEVRAGHVVEDSAEVAQKPGRYHVSFICAGAGSISVAVEIGAASHHAELACTSSGSSTDFDVDVDKAAPTSTQTIKPAAGAKGFAGYQITRL